MAKTENRDAPRLNRQKRLKAEPDPEARCPVAPIAREAARICRAIATVEKAEDAAAAVA